MSESKPHIPIKVRALVDALIRRTERAILVWDWDDAPEEYRKLSRRPHATEWWVAFVPTNVMPPHWLYHRPFDERAVPQEDDVDGGRVFIGGCAT